MRTFLLASAAALLLLPAAAAAQSDERQRIDTSFAFDKGGVVDLGHISGDIIVTGWTKPEIKIFATIEIGYLEATMSSSRVRITAKSRRNRMGKSHYELSVPIGTEVRVSNISGNVAVRGVAGAVTVSTVSGDVEVRDASGRVEIGTVSGELRGYKLAGSIRVRSTSGDLRLEDVDGDVSGKTVSGSITVLGTLGNVEFQSLSGDVRFSGDLRADASFRANTHSGDVRVTLPSNLNANVEVQTFSGSFRTAFPVTIQPGERVGARNRRMYGTIGSGGGRIRLETFSGDVTIEKGAARPTKED